VLWRFALARNASPGQYQAEIGGYPGNVSPMESLEQKLSAFPLGTKVSAKVLSLNPDQIEMLGAHAGLWQRFQTMSPKLKSGLDGQSIDQFLAMLNPEIDALQQFLALDPR
jgi:hypothetical protein